MIYLDILLTVTLLWSTLASGDEGVIEEQRVKRQGFTGFGQSFFLPSFRFPNSTPGGSTISPGRLVSSSNGFFPSFVTQPNVRNILFRPVNVPAQRSNQRLQPGIANFVQRQQTQRAPITQQQQQPQSSSVTQQQQPQAVSFTRTNFPVSFGRPSSVLFSSNNQAPSPAVVSTSIQTVGVPISSTGPQGSTNFQPSRNQFTSLSNTPQFSNQFTLAGNPLGQPIRSFTLDLSREDFDDSREILLLNQNQNNAFRNNNQLQGSTNFQPSRNQFTSLSNTPQFSNQFTLAGNPLGQPIRSFTLDLSREDFDDSREILLLNRNQNNAFRNSNPLQLSNVQGTGQFRVVPDITDEIFDDDSREIFLRTSGFTSARQLLNPSALTPRPRNNQGVTTGFRGSPQRPLFSVDIDDGTFETFEFTNERFDTTDERFDDSNERFGLFSQRFLRSNIRAKRDFGIDSPESHENDFLTRSRPKPVDTRVKSFQQYNFDTIGSHENDFLSGEGPRPIFSADLGAAEETLLEGGTGEIFD